MGIPLDDDAFDALFRDYRYTAWRLETRTAYGKVDEDEPYQQWLSGKDPGIGWFEPWLRMMREEWPRGNGWSGCGSSTIPLRLPALGTVGDPL
ncbi:hypothetical protein GCM10027294_50950 [Marinactinospora endophytica]